VVILRISEEAIVAAQDHHTKQELVSFKVDAELADMLRRMPNKSQFIRKAVLQALDHEAEQEDEHHEDEHHDQSTTKTTTAGPSILISGSAPTRW